MPSRYRPPTRRQSESEPRSDPALTLPATGLRGLLARYGRRLWWLHSLYALGLGVFVVTFARRGYDYAQWLGVLLAAVWLLTLLLFRVSGSGRDQRVGTAGEKARFLAMTYVLKNLYQGMLFFALPFYFEAATLDAPNRWFLVALAACAVLSTLDLVFDRVLMRWRLLASIFYMVVLFAAFQLSVPALLLGAPPRLSLLVSAGLAAVAFFTLHVPPRAWVRPTSALMLVASVSGALALAWFGQTAIPPVPLRLVHGAVGPMRLADGQFNYELAAVHHTVLGDLVATTEVGHPSRVPAAQAFRHVWRHDGAVVVRAEPVGVTSSDRHTVKLKSALPLAAHAADPTASPQGTDSVGAWSLDVETRDGQLVGRVRFDVR